MVQAAQPPRAEDFALQLPLAAERGDGLHALEPTEAVLRVAQHADLRDLRVFNARGEALPLARLPAQPAPAPRIEGIAGVPLVPLPAAVEARERLLSEFALRIEKDAARTLVELTSQPPARANANGVGSYLIDLRAQHERHRDSSLHAVLLLDFALAAVDFAARVELLGSEDLVNWQPVGAGALVRNRQFGEAFERGEFDLARVPPFVRLSWQGVAAPQLAGARFGLRTAAAPTPLPRAKLVATPAEKAEKAAGAVESWYVELPPGLPVIRLHLRVPRDNQALRVQLWRELDAQPRRARLALRPRRAPEHWVADGGPRPLYRIDRAGVTIENAPFAWNTQGARLRIDALDAGFGAAPTVEAEWRPLRIAFAASAPPYTLAVGLDDDKLAPPPSLDLARLLPADDPAGLTLPAASFPAGAAAAQPPMPKVERGAAAGASRALLWGVLGVAVLLLAAMAWRLGRQLRAAGGSSAGRAPAGGKARRRQIGPSDAANLRAPDMHL